MTRTTDLGAVTEAGQYVKHARADLLAAMNTVRQTAFTALNNGASEVAVAKAAGVDRNTIRRWQGK